MESGLDIDVQATGEGRVRVLIDGGGFVASPQGAVKLAHALLREAKVAAQISEIEFVAVGSGPASDTEPAPDNKPSDAKAELRRPRASSSEQIAEMITAGYLFEGETLKGRYPAAAASESLTTLRADGHMVDTDGNVYRTPGRAASALINRIPSNYNTWFVWKAHRDGRSVSLNAIRDAHRSGRPARARTEW